MSKIRTISEKLSNGNIYLTFKIGKTEICYSSEWGALELWSGDENILDNNKSKLYTIVSEIKSKYTSTFNDEEGIYEYSHKLCE